MNSHDAKKQPAKGTQSAKSAAPDPDAKTPNTNVGLDGQCLVPSFQESDRLDTGEPCDDGRSGVKR